MKRRGFLFLVIALLMSGCATNTSLKPGEIKTAYIGDTVFSYSNPADMIGHTLTLVGITDKSILIHYSEDFYSLAMGGTYARPAFDRKLEYSRKSKIIRYKFIRLQILKVTNESITYKNLTVLPNK